MLLEKMIDKNKVLLVAPSLMIDKVVPWTHAVNLLLFRDAYTILERDTILHSSNFEMNMPLVIAHGSNYARKDRKYNMNDCVSKKTIKLRDAGICAYCGDYGNTIDHIYPKALGGKSTYGNMCLACEKCNFKKGSKTLAEVGYKMPVIPERIPYRNTLLQTALFETLEMAV